MDAHKVHVATCITAAAGAVVAVVPALATGLIVTSKAIFINVIANIALTILTFGTYGIAISGISLVPVPLLFWQVSLVCAAVGAGIIGLALTVMAINKIVETIQNRRLHA